MTTVFTHKTRAGLLLCALVLALTACQKPEGPAEKAGKSIEDAAKGKK